RRVSAIANTHATAVDSSHAPVCRHFRAAHIVWAQPPVDLLLPEHAASAARRDVPSRRARKAHVNPRGLEARELRLSLFDDVQVTVRRTRLDRPGPDSTVWVG